MASGVAEVLGWYKPSLKVVVGVGLAPPAPSPAPAPAVAVGTGVAELVSPAPEPPEPPELAPQFPTGGALFAAALVTSLPGLGNIKSPVPSALEVHPFPTLATNMSGKALRPLPPLPEMVTTAQFMYISRLPISLNQLQAKMASPALASAGTVKGNVPPLRVGHEPMNDFMTFQVFPPSSDRDA